MTISKSFDKDFVFGVGTSALQIEEDGMHDWKNVKAKDGTTLDKAIKHLEKWREDYQLIVELGVSAYKTSVDWSRLQNSPYAKLDQKNIDMYCKMFGFLKENNVDLWLTLHHFANPLWFTDQKGWMNKESPDVFEDFASKAVETFKDYTNHIITINEPITYVGLAYVEGFVPPHGKSPLSAIRGLTTVTDNMAEAHKKAYRSIKRLHEDKKVGFTEVTRPFVSYNDNFVNKGIASLLDYILNVRSWDKMMGSKDDRTADFIGMQYYGPFAVNAFGKELLTYRPDKLHDDLWEVDPRQMITFAKSLRQKYDLPVFVMENGTCTDDDNIRTDFLMQHLDEIQKANNNEKLIEGYFYWSAFDNFELDKGLSKRFGLIHIDFETFKRTPKNSYHVYKDIIRDKTVD